MKNYYIDLGSSTIKVYCFENELKLLEEHSIYFKNDFDEKKGISESNLKEFFRKILQIGNEPTKEATTSEIKSYYDKDEFKTNDVYDISKGTTKEDKLFDYVGIPDYYKTRKKSHNYERDKYDYEISL